MAHDIVIIGAGPAGASTALHMAALAPDLIPRTLVIDKARYPRHKLCAGALVSDAEVMLEGLGLDVSEVPHVDATVAHLDFQGAGVRLEAPRGGRMLRMIQRDEFDAWLVAKVRAKGIEVREGVTAHSVRTTGTGAMVATQAGEIEAQVVVGADGSKGVTRGSILPHERMHTARALEVVMPAADGQAHAADEAYFDFCAVPDGIGGYVWDFPTQLHGRPSRCWGVYDANLFGGEAGRLALRAPLEAEMRRHGPGLEGHVLQGHPIRWFGPRKTFAVPRVLLAGDAAGADGIFGEGISIALGHGLLAARALRDAFRSGDFSFPDYRRRLLRSPLGMALTRRWLITQVLYRMRRAWMQRVIWSGLGPLIAWTGVRLVLNWAPRMRGEETD